MKKFGLTLVLTILTYQATQCQSLPSKKEQYDFLRWYINYKHLVPLDSSLKLKGDFSYASIDNVHLSVRDKIYMKRQIQLLRNRVKLDSISLRELNWQPTKRGNGTYISYFSLPIFSLNRKMVIINWGTYCGMTCGKESLDVFIKTIDDKWRIKKTTAPIIVF